jgi:hypothetical protein
VLKSLPDPIACEGSMAWVYTYTDCAGNTDDWTYTYTIEYIPFPAIESTTATFDCVDDIVMPTLPEVKDNCGNVLTGVPGTAPTAPECEGDMVYTWTYTDCAGNQQTYTHTITIELESFEAITPTTATVACVDEIEIPTLPEVKDKCGNVLTGVAGTAPTPPVGNGEMVYTWTYTDCAGNQQTYTHTITILDDVPPSFDCPSDLSVQCFDEVPDAQSYLEYITDNCGVDTPTYSVNEVSEGTCPVTITRIITISDFSGNLASCTHKIVVHDKTAPVLADVDAEIFVECLDQVPPMIALGWTDNCDGQGTVTGTDGPYIGDDCEGTITRTWDYTDACGNKATRTQTIVVRDITPPVLHGVGPDLTINCPEDPEDYFSKPWATDNCDDDVTLLHFDKREDGICPGEYTITRYWYARDNCNNCACDQYQTITVVDNTPPVVTVPGPTTIECHEDPVFADPVITDACDDNVDFVFFDSRTPGDCPGEFTVTRYYTATDACGNVGCAFQIINVVDNTGPVITADVESGDLGCNPDDVTPVFTAVDACEGTIASVTVTTLGPENDGCDYSQTWTANASDGCGNAASPVSITYTWRQDNTAPAISGTLTETTVTGCSMAAVPAAVTTVAELEAMGLSIRDNCSAADLLEVRHDDVISGSCPTQIARTYTVMDECSNESTILHTIYLATPELVVGKPADMNVSACEYRDQAALDAAFAMWLTEFTVSGGCTPTASYGTPVAPVLCAGGSTLVTYSYSDVCESGTVTASFTVNKPAPIVVGKPADYTKAAEEFLSQDEVDAAFAAWLTGFTVTGGCDPEGSYGTPSAPSICGESKVVTYTVTDLCESDVVSATFTITSANQLVISYPSDVEASACDFADQADLEADFALWLQGFSVSGGINPSGTYGTTVTPVFCAESSIRVIYEVTDVCGSGSVQATYTVHAPSELVVTSPGNLTVPACQYDTQAEIDAAFASWLEGFGVTGGCNLEGSYGTPVAPRLCTGGTVTVTYNVMDKCETASAIASFTLGTLGDPVITVPSASLTLDCYDAEEVDAWIAGASAVNSCGETIEVYAAYDPPLTNCNETVMVTFTAEDACGNTVTASKSFIVNDNLAPQFTCPDDVTLYTAGTATSTSWVAPDLTGSDNCSPADLIVFTGVRSDGKLLNDPWPLGTTTITWTAADECKNLSAPCLQTVTVISGCLNIVAKVYLEGSLINPATSSDYAAPMRTTLNDLQMLPGQAYQDGATIFYTPAGQPYNTAPWNYSGSEGSLFDTGGSVGDAGYPATAVDWVLVSLRDTPGAGYQKICEKAALLLSDGTIVMPESFGCCDIDMTGTYYLVVEHRNHLIVMSHEALPIVNGTLTYDFTTQNSYVLPGSGAVGQKEANGMWFMYGGNGNQTETDNSDTDINADDQSTWENHNGKQGYRPGDYNMNGDTNSNDQIIWERNNGRTSVIRDY